jgi:hypothetical protein
MKIYLKEKIVQKATFEENVLTLTTTGQWQSLFNILGEMRCW